MEGREKGRWGRAKEQFIPITAHHRLLTVSVMGWIGKVDSDERAADGVGWVDRMDE